MNLNPVKIITIIAIILLVVNIILVSFRIITNAIFWVLLICITIISFSLQKILGKIYKD